MPTAFVLSGGCSLGAVQVGMAQALADQQIAPDLLVGTSVGAINAAYLAGHGTGRASADALADIWTGLRLRSLFRVDLAALVRVLAGGTALCSDSGLRRLLRTHLTFETLEDSPIPLHVVTTDLLSGREVVLDEGRALDAVLASCAIPGVFPPVSRSGRLLVDGGLADNTPISAAVAAGADTVYVLPGGYACALSRAPRTPLGVALHSLSVIMQQRLVLDVATYADKVDLVVLPPPCPLDVAPLDFAHAAGLIGRSRSAALSFLARDGGRRADPAAAIAVHEHEHDPALTPGRG